MSKNKLDRTEFSKCSEEILSSIEQLGKGRSGCFLELVTVAVKIRLVSEESDAIKEAGKGLLSVVNYQKTTGSGEMLTGSGKTCTAWVDLKKLAALNKMEIVERIELFSSKRPLSLGRLPNGTMVKSAEGVIGVVKPTIEPMFV